MLEGLLTRRRLWVILGSAAVFLVLYHAPRQSLHRYPPAVPIKLDPLHPSYIDNLPDLELPGPLLHPAHEDLARQLHAFLWRPIRGNDTGSLAYEAGGCPRDVSDKLVNPDQWAGNINDWLAVDAAHVREQRVKIVQYLASVAGQLEKTGKGRGIVMTAGNQDTTQRTITSLGMLRATGCTLPVEVFHYPSEQLDSGAKSALRGLGATIHAVTGVEKQAGAWKNWQLKGSALIQSSFSQILYLDSDNTAISDPTPLFSHPRFLATGAAFWPDLSKDHTDNAIWRIMGEQCSLQTWTFESGQILLDKSAHLVLAALYIVEHMLKDQDEWFKYCGGDKDTFRWAWRALDLPWTDPGAWMATVGWEVERHGRNRFCGHSTLQFGLDTVDAELPRPMFMHSNLLKHIGHTGRGRGQIFTQVKHWPNSTYHSAHLNYANTHVVTDIYSGFCLDMEWHELAHERLTEAQREQWAPSVIPTEDWVADGKSVFEGYEDSFWEHGGRVGGW